MSIEDTGFEPRATPVKNLRPGMENISIVVRVLDSLGVRTIMTKAGQRTIGEYIVGDASGKVKLVAWGTKASALNKDDVVLIENAWVSQYRGEVQANIGRSSRISKQPNTAVPPMDEIPDEGPEPLQDYRPRRAPGRGRRGTPRTRRDRRGGF